MFLRSVPERGQERGEALSGALLPRLDGLLLREGLAEGPAVDVVEVDGFEGGGGILEEVSSQVHQDLGGDDFVPDGLGAVVLTVRLTSSPP